MSSSLHVGDVEFFELLLTHGLHKCIPLEMCKRFRLVSRGFCRAVTHARPRVHVTMHPSRDALVAWCWAVHVVCGWARIVRVDLTPVYARIESTYLCRVLRACDHLEHITLHSVAMSPAACPLVLAAANTGNKLTHIDLEGSVPGLFGCEKLLSVLPALYNLRVLSLAGNSLYGEASKALAEVLRRCKSLEEVDLGANGLDTEGCQRVCGVLKTSTTLSRLFLPQNLLRHTSARDIANLMAGCAKLRHLDLSDNLLCDGGTAMLASQIPRTACLETLVLGGNCIHNFGAVALARALRDSATLRHLDLSHNFIEAEGVAALKRAALGNSLYPRSLVLDANFSPQVASYRQNTNDQILDEMIARSTATTFVIMAGAGLTPYTEEENVD